MKSIIIVAAGILTLVACAPQTKDAYPAMTPVDNASGPCGDGTVLKDNEQCK